MEQGEQTMGQMLTFFKQMAVSPASFQAYMDFEAALQGGALGQLTREAVYLGTSTTTAARTDCRPTPPWRSKQA